MSQRYLLSNRVYSVDQRENTNQAVMEQFDNIKAHVTERTKQETTTNLEYRLSSSKSMLVKVVDLKTVFTEVLEYCCPSKKYNEVLVVKKQSITCLWHLQEQIDSNYKTELFLHM